MKSDGRTWIMISKGPASYAVIVGVSPPRTGSIAGRGDDRSLANQFGPFREGPR